MLLYSVILLDVDSLAFKVAAEGLDPRSTPVSQIMTKSPLVTRDTTSATEALQLMVERHFRHLVISLTLVFLRGLHFHLARL